MKNLKTLSAVAAISLIGFGCSSSSGDGASTSTLSGIYTGVVIGGRSSANGDEKAIIYNDRLMMFATVFNIQSVMDSQLTVTDSNFTGTLSIYSNFASINFTGTADLSGNIDSNNIVSATFINTNATTNDGSFTLTPNTTVYSKGSNLSRVTGSWQGTHGGLSDATTIAVDATGTITSGSDLEGCNFTGSIIPADTSVNVYNATLISTGGTGCTSLPPATYTGFAWTEGTTDTTMNFTVADGINSRSVILTKL